MSGGKVSWMTRLRELMRLPNTQYPIRFLAAFVFVCALGLGQMAPARAQTPAPEAAWTKPVNLSNSGGASLPAVEIDANDIAHVVWWDVVDGAQYSRSAAPVTAGAALTWLTPTAAPAIVGDRETVLNARTGTSAVRITRYENLRLLSDGGAGVLAIWQDALGGLQGARETAGAWSAASPLAASALTYAASKDAAGAVHLVYVRPISTIGAQAGIYYRAAVNGVWSAANPVYLSPYFRTASAADLHLSVASAGGGKVIAAWSDPRTARAMFARSADNGATWQPPQPAPLSADAGIVDRAWVAATSQGELLWLGHDTTVPGCGLYQRASADGGQTWGASRRIFAGLSLCPAEMTFSYDGEGRVWLTGIPPLPAPTPGQTASAVRRDPRMALAAYSGGAWSAAAVVGLTLNDPASGGGVTPKCSAMALSKTMALWLGCDLADDVWAALGGSPIGQMMTALTSRWRGAQVFPAVGARVVSAGSAPAIVASSKENVFAAWSTAARASEPGSALAVAELVAERWSRPNEVLQSPAQGRISSVSAVLSKAAQPALAISKVDDKERVYAVWSGATGGQIFYSWAFLQDATSAQGWAAPVALPSPLPAGSAPHIVAGADGKTLHVVYAIPFNEGRGIYYTRSADGGANWSAATQVFNAAAAGWEGADEPHLAIGGQGLDVIWERAVLPGSAARGAIGFAHSGDEGKTWGATGALAEGAVSDPRLVNVGNTLLATWLTASPTDFGQISARRSADGQTWSDVGVDATLRRAAGPADVAVREGEAYLAAVTARADDDAFLGVYRFDGQGWVSVDQLDMARGARVGDAASLALGPNSEVYVAAQVLGNADGNPEMRVATLGLKPGSAAPAAATSASASASAPASAAAGVPTLAPVSAVTPVPIATQAPTPTVAFSTTSVNASANSTTVLLIAGVVASVLVLGLSVVFGLGKRM